MSQTQPKKKKPPYAAAGDLDRFFERIAKMGDPKTFDTKWVEAFKLSAAQPEAIVKVLKWLGIAEEKDGKSTGIWDEVRVPASRKEKLAALVESSYKEIFDQIDVAEADRSELDGAFVQAYGSGDPTRQVKCFIALCGHAGITIKAAKTGRASPKPSSTPKTAGTTKPAGKPKATPSEKDETDQPDGGTGESVRVTLNVEIPAEWSEEQIRERYETVRRATRGDATDAP